MGLTISIQSKLAGRDFFCVCALSAAALMLESTLTRLLAVAQYYHFAFLVVSLALLGFGASGSFLSIFPGWISKHDDQGRNLGRDRTLVISGLGFSASLVIAYIIINWLPFDSYSIAWDRRQVIYFVIYYLILAIPFLFAGLGIGAVLSSSPGENNRVYAVNLIGSAIGILLGLFVMQFAGVPGGLLASGVLGISAVLGSRGLVSRFWRTVIWGMLILGIMGVLSLSITNQRFNSPIGISISPYKGLPYALQVPNAERIFGSWNAFSRIDVIAGASTHILPGLSYTYSGSLPEQLGMAFDGDALRPVTLIDPDQFRAADYLPEAAAFHLHPDGKALVLDSGSGFGAVQALASGASQVRAVVDNPLIIKAISESAPDHDIYQHVDVQTISEATRVYLASHVDEFDVIMVPLNEPYRPVANGAYSLAENYKLTVEAFSQIFSRLTTDGVLVVTRWLQTPPSEELRMWATLIEAISRMGIEDPGSKLVAYRGIQTMTILVQLEGWNEDQLAIIREFTKLRRFDLVWAVDIEAQEANRFNKLDEAVYYRRFSELLAAESRERYYDNYPYSIHPTTDDHPFFFHFFKWEQAPQILATFGRVWQPFGGSGYFVLIALLFLVSVFSIILIVIPLLINRNFSDHSLQQSEQHRTTQINIPLWRVFVYFGSIGIAFLFLEIPLIQKCILSMGQPAYAFGLVVLVLLVSSSVGSMYSRRFWQRKELVLLILFGCALLTPLAFSKIQEISLGWPQILRIFALGASIVPLGILMGFPFPFGLVWLERAESNLIPWAWAVNGCASVVAAVFAAIISLSAGFSVVLLLGAIFYGGAALAIRS